MSRAADLRADYDALAAKLVTADGAAAAAIVRMMHCDGHLPVAVTQHPLQPGQNDRIAIQFGKLPFPVERIVQTLQVAGRFTQIRSLHLDVMQAHAGIERDVAVFGFLAHDLTVHLALGRDVDDQVTPDQRLAAQAVVLLQRFAALAETLLDNVGRRQVFGPGAYRMLAEITDRADDPAAAAKPAAAAH